jgi:DNA-directed RNA polymerase subunit RPC12/RpoP
MQTIECPYCACKLLTDPKLASQSVICPTCRRQFRTSLAKPKTKPSNERAPRCQECGEEFVPSEGQRRRRTCLRCERRVTPLNKAGCLTPAKTRSIDERRWSPTTWLIAMGAGGLIVLAATVAYPTVAYHFRTLRSDRPGVNTHRQMVFPLREPQPTGEVRTPQPTHSVRTPQSTGEVRTPQPTDGARTRQPTGEANTRPPPSMRISGELFVTTTTGDVKKAAGLQLVFTPITPELRSTIGSILPLAEEIEREREAAVKSIVRRQFAGKDPLFFDIVEIDRASTIEIAEYDKKYYQPAAYPLYSKMKTALQAGAQATITNGDGKFDVALPHGRYLLRSDKMSLLGQEFGWCKAIDTQDASVHLILNQGAAFFYNGGGHDNYQALCATARELGSR